MEKVLGFLENEFLGNTFREYAIFLVLILFILIFKKYISRLLSNLIYHFLKKYADKVTAEKFYELLHKPISFFMVLLFIYIALGQLEYPEAWGLKPSDEFGWRMISGRLYLTLVISSLIWLGLRFIDFFGLLLLKRAEKTDSKTDDAIVPFFIEILKIIWVILGVFVILGTVFRINIGSLVAGLGIGGLAIALAAKETLENLLGSFTIFLDKPFQVGDMVKVGDMIGYVEKIGLRSTRIRTLEKSVITMPNKKMIDAELDNMSERTYYRAHYMVGLVYGTTTEQIEKIVADIQKLLDDHPHTSQDGIARFTEFGASSLDITVLYFVEFIDWAFFLRIKEEVNYEIIKIVKKHGSSFAFPSRSLYFENSIPKS